MRWSSRAPAKPVAQISIDRLYIVGGLIFLLTGGLYFRIFQLQVNEHNQYAQAALTQSTEKSELKAPRGKIFAVDKEGQLHPLAVSRWVYDIEFAPRQIKDKIKLASQISQIVGNISESEILEKLNYDRPYVSRAIKGVEESIAQKVRALKKPGLFVVGRLDRFYPEGEALAAQLIGFVDHSGEGKYGIEAMYDSDLRGIAGAQRARKDSLGAVVAILETERSKAGADLILTLDYNLQFVVESKLKEALNKYGAESGSIVVMNPKTGAILAMANQPTYDPNQFSKLPASEHHRFMSAAISDIYEPGSVVKPLTMAAALDLGVVEPQTTETFGGSVQVLDRVIRNADNKVFGRQNMTQILENSDNVALAWLSAKIGSENLRAYLEKFGFGQKTGIDLTGEQTAKLREIKEWNEVLRSTAAFGQGISATVLQMAVAYSAIANGGEIVTPYLVEKVITEGQARKIEHAKPRRILKSETAAQVREMLASVVINGHGKRAAVEGLRIGGKTGTAQVSDLRGGYSEDRFIGSFAGIVDVENPQVVMVVRLNNPKVVRFAESSAAPTFGEIARWVTHYYQLSNR